MFVCALRRRMHDEDEFCSIDICKILTVFQSQDFPQQFIVLFECWGSVSQVTQIRLSASTYGLDGVTTAAEEKHFNFQRHKSHAANNMQFSK